MTPVRVSMTIPGIGTISDTDSPSESVTAITSALKVEVDNGTGPGDIRERKAEFQLAFHLRNRDAMTQLLEGTAVDVTITFAGLSIPMRGFFISQVSWRPSRRWMIADVLALSDGPRMTYNQTYSGALTPPKRANYPGGDPPVNPFAHQIFRQDATGAMARDHVAIVYQENNRVGHAWADEVVNNSVWGVDAQFDSAQILEYGQAYDWNPFIAWVARPLLARGWIEEGKFGFHVARWGGDAPIEIPPQFVQADRATTYSVEQFPNVYWMKWRSNPNRWVTVPGEVARFQRVETTLDLTDNVFSLGRDSTKLDLDDMRLVWRMKPRNRWRLSDSTVRLSRWADSSEAARVTARNLIRDIFRTPTPTTTFIPSVRVPLAMTDDGLPYELWGTVDHAVLTINPNESPDQRAVLNLTLATGDGRGSGLTPWNEYNYVWRAANTIWRKV